MRYVFGILGFVLIALGAAVALDTGGFGRRYLGFLSRAASGQGSIMPMRWRRLIARPSRQLRLVAGAGLVLVGVSWVLIATWA